MITDKFKKVFTREKALIGMIHVDALPGTPKYKNNFNKVLDKAIFEARLYKSLGIDAIMVENMHDIPYVNRNVGPEITASMAIISDLIKKESKLPAGIQILASANKEALSVALVANLDFIRVEGFVFGHVADEGYIDSCASELLRYRKNIGADEILIFTDIKKKHSAHTITSDVDIVETAHAAEFFLSDGVIITGASTGKEASLIEIQKVSESVKIPVLVGSGINLENIKKYRDISDALIIGSYFKKDGYWENDIDPKKVEDVIKKVKLS